MMIPGVLFLLGLLCLIKGGDWFVDGASALARQFHLPELLIGATVVSVGTTLPEVMVSTISAVSGHGEIAYGNAIGSVICNTALIAAITVAVRPGKVDPKPLRVPVAFFFAAAAIYCVAAYGMGRFTRPMGLLMLGMFVAYMAANVWQMKNAPAEPEHEEEPMGIGKIVLLLVVGALLTSAPLAGVLPFLRWEPVQLAGGIIYKCLTAVISNLSVLFCTGLAAALAKREKHQAAFIALMSYLVYLTAGNVTLTELGLLAQPDALTGLYSAGQTMVLGIQTVDTGVFGGILLGLLTAFVYDRTCEKAHRGILGGVFSGVRWSFACVAALAAVLGSGACFVWPPIQKAIAAVTGFIAASGNIGLFLYGFLERLLIPTGLHHLVYMPFQFSQLGGQLMVGSVTYTGAYVVMMTEYNLGLPFSDGIVWMYTGFTKTFGYFGIAAAFIFCARRGSRKRLPFSCCRWPLRHRWLPLRSRWIFCSASRHRFCGWRTQPSPAASSCCCTCAESRRLPRTFWGRL